jgi:hypothetical protein
MDFQSVDYNSFVKPTTNYVSIFLYLYKLALLAKADFGINLQCFGDFLHPSQRVRCVLPNTQQKESSDQRILCVGTALRICRPD